jgi:hypothetical protein
VTAMRNMASVMATTPVPSPKVVDATVFHEPSTRTLAVRLNESAGGYEQMLWRQSYQDLRKSEEAGRQHRTVWASGGGGNQIAFAACGDYQMLTFHFPVGKGDVYGKLIGRPGLAAFVSIDRELCYFMGVRFLHRP